MTEEQFQTLARYEDNLRQASGGRWARHPGRTALAEIYKIVADIAGPQPRLQVFCQPCVLRVLKKAADLYFAEKAAREQAVADAKKEERKAKAVQTAKKESDASKAAKKPTAPKKPRPTKIVS